jgi:hypothetical protein
MIAVSRHFMSNYSYEVYVVLAYQSAHTAVANTQAVVYQIFCYAWLAITDRIETGLFFECARLTKSGRCRQLTGRLRNVHGPHAPTSTKLLFRLAVELATCFCAKHNCMDLSPLITGGYCKISCSVYPSCRACARS